jgi:hypothetical protein
LQAVIETVINSYFLKNSWLFFGKDKDKEAMIQITVDFSEPGGNVFGEKIRHYEFSCNVALLSMF